MILVREFDQKRLELLENKDQQIKELKKQIELELSTQSEKEIIQLKKNYEEKIELVGLVYINNILCTKIK
jgi:transcription initiation factor TFIIIB Brf1 subunit/transcription initiation factor TFIIB